MTRRYMDAREMAAYLGTTVVAVYHAVERRRLPFSRVGRRLVFDRRAIDRTLAQNSVTVAAGPAVDTPGSDE